MKEHGGLHLPLNVARAVILGDTQFLRFEQFANDLVSKMEGDRPVLSTSLTYDRGRDGKTVGPGPRVYVCSSLNDIPDDKALSDIDKIVQSRIAVQRIYFCSSQKLTENAGDKIAGLLRGKLGNDVAVEFLGAYDLAEFAIRFPEVAHKSYSAEITDILQAFEPSQQADEASRLALELALCTVGHDDSSAIRASAYVASLRTVLLDGTPRNVAECARDLAARLKLGRSLPASAIKLYLDILEKQRDVTILADRYSLTESGRTAADAATGDAAQALMKGRREVRVQIEDELGFSLEDNQFATMWRTLQDKLALLFYSRGREMVEGVAALLGQNAGSVNPARKGTAPAADDPSGPFFAKALGDAVAATCSSPELAERVQVALSDIFSEGTGAAFEWLVEVCAGFVTICSLGLEASSGQKIRDAVSRIALIFDTDVLLSLLGEAEPDHAAVAEMARRWRELGGQILLADPVLRETAYHAWISERDFREVESWLPGSDLDRVRFIKNVFVRSFAALISRQRARGGQWRTYISQFRGSSEYDARPLHKHVSSESKAGALPRILEHESGWEREVWDVCEDRAVQGATSERDRKIKIDKARRDAELYVSMVRYSETLRDTELEGHCFLVSSAHRLADLEAEFHQGERPRVLSIGAVLHMLALVPGVSVGLTALGSLLFDGSFHKGMSDLGMVLRRVLKDSDGFSMPWASRTTLERDMRARLVARAAEGGGTYAEKAKRAKEMEREVVSGEKPEATATLLKEALDQIGADTRLEKQLADARRRIAELEAAVARKSREQP